MKYSNDIHDTLQIIEIEAAMLKLVINKDNKKAMELAERVRKRAAELKNKINKL